MKKKLLVAAGIAALSFTPNMASAQDDGGWYLRGNVGYGAHHDAEFDQSILRGDIESEGNAALSLGLGYEFDNNWRLELDGDSLWTDMGEIGQINASYAKLRTNSLMLNAIYDFDDFNRWEPYVGIGAGLIKAQLDAEAHDFLSVNGVSVANPACLGGVNGTCRVDDSAKGLGWQLLAGLGYQVTENLTWDTHYTFMDVLQDNMDFDGVFTSSNLTDAATLLAGANGFNHNVELQDVGAHSLMTGFRYRFGEPTPMSVCWDGSEVKNLADCPARPPAMKTCWDGSEILATDVCPAEPVREVVQTYTCWDGTTVTDLATCPAQPTITCWDGSIVYDQASCPVETRSRETVASLCGNQYRQEIIYYEFDKGQSAETRNTINRILDIGEFCQVGSIRVVGHTDTSGAASYNLALSQRRAKDARDELVRQGINGALITSEGKGETEPFVQTGDGVKEQLNRRTEVLITLNEVGGIN